VKKKGLGARLKALFAGGLGSEESFEELEDLLIESDIGAQATMAISDQLRERSKAERANSRDELMELLRDELTGMVKARPIVLDPDRLNIVLLLGINGVGKTTTLAKLATYFRKTGQASRIVMAAGDTFRAAAVEQLTIHAERIGVRIVSQGNGADPGAVIYDAIESAGTRNEQLVLADTAGRMHTKANLVAELSKIDRIVASRAADAAYHRLLVIDATTGQNGLRQAETFSQAVELSGIVLAKYDSTAKGGILVPIARDLGIPASFVGTGETYDDLRPFDAQTYVRELLGIE
jgi:fused signal recognition particle receptor